VASAPDHRQAAHERRSREAGQVAHDPAADGHDRRVAIQAVAHEPIPQPLGLAEALALLALRDDEDCRLESGAAEAVRDARRVRLDGGLRDDGRAAPQPKLGALRSRRVEETRSDVNRVAPARDPP
jgi:hypothetical protein